jgi:putative Mn2+ efflux pump MntP
MISTRSRQLYGGILYFMGYLFNICVLTPKQCHIHKQTHKKMKNSFKLTFLALAIAVSAAACGGNKSTTGSDTTVKDTTVAPVDTVKTDSVVVAPDTTKKDSVK